MQQKIVFAPTIWIWRAIRSNLLLLIKFSRLYNLNSMPFNIEPFASVLAKIRKGGDLLPSCVTTALMLWWLHYHHQILTIYWCRSAQLLELNWPSLLQLICQPQCRQDVFKIAFWFLRLFTRCFVVNRS